MRSASQCFSEPGSSPQPGEEQTTDSKNSRIKGRNSGKWIALALCVAVLAAGVMEQFFRNRPDYAESFAPDWIAIAAAIIAAAGIMQLNERPRWLLIQRAFLWAGLLLMVWTANGLPFDLLRLTPLIPLEVDWPGMATRTLSFAAVIMIARIALAHPDNPPATHSAAWYGYAAFALALPYPVLRIFWAFGATPGLMHPGAGGSGFAPLLLAIPWLMAAALSLLLVSKRRFMSRKLLLTAGWTATAIVSMIGPAAFWSMVNRLITGEDLGNSNVGLATWVPCLIYGSWFFWAIAAGAATRSYQLRSADSADNRFESVY